MSDDVKIFTPSTNLITGEELRQAIADQIMADCDFGRPLYQLVDEEEMFRFLAHTKIDRNIWHQAQPSTATPEVVCAEIAELMFGLLVQEGLRCGLLYPMAIGRISLNPMTGKDGHSMDFFLNQNRQFRFIEEQNDQIYSFATFRPAYPDLIPNKCEVV